MLTLRAVQPAPAASAIDGLRWIARAAVLSLHDELALEAKPGLVTLTSNGSHDDMDAATFLRSIASLRAYFDAIAQLGAAHAPFAALEALGIEAEGQMLRATGGINTHRGAIFLLGLICASAGALLADGRRCSAAAIRTTLESLWGDALRRRLARHSTSNGARAVRRFGVCGAAAEAALGFPTLFEQTLPALRSAQARGLDHRAARLQALFAAMADLDDTTLIHRGGLAGLRFAQAQAREYLAAGGAARADAWQHARELDRRFTARRLSPGGSADLLAAACLLDRLEAAPATVHA